MQIYIFCIQEITEIETQTETLMYHCYHHTTAIWMVVQGYKQNLFISLTVYEETDFEEVGTDLVEIFFF